MFYYELCSRKSLKSLKSSSKSPEKPALPFKRSANASSRNSLPKIRSNLIPCQWPLKAQRTGSPSRKRSTNKRSARSWVSKRPPIITSSLLLPFWSFCCFTTSLSRSTTQFSRRIWSFPWKPQRWFSNCNSRLLLSRIWWTPSLWTKQFPCWTIP